LQEACVEEEREEGGGGGAVEGGYCHVCSFYFCWGRRGGVRCEGQAGERDTQRQTETDRDRDRQREVETETETHERQIQRDKYKETNTKRQIQRHKKREPLTSVRASSSIKSELPGPCHEEEAINRTSALLFLSNRQLLHTIHRSCFAYLLGLGLGLGLGSGLGFGLGLGLGYAV